MEENCKFIIEYNAERELEAIKNENRGRPDYADESRSRKYKEF